MPHIDDRKQEGLGYLLGLASSYCRSKVLFVATDFGIYSVLSRSEKDIKEIAKELQLEPRPLEMLLNACVSLGLLKKKDGLYSNSPTSELFLVKGKPMYVGEAFSVLDRRSYMLWDKLKEAIKTNRPQAYGKGGGDLFEEMTKNEDETHAFFQGLHALAYWPANSLAGVLDFSPYNHLLDVGGGSGAYSIAITKRHKHLKATLLDLPPVCKIAKEYIFKENLSNAITTFPGDFFKDDFPHGPDVILFSNLLHDWDKTKVEYLLKKAFDSLPSKGRVVISDMVLSNDGTDPIYATLMSLTLLLDTCGGSNYTEEQFISWLERSGFHEISIKQLTGPNMIATAIKP